MNVKTEKRPISDIEADALVFLGFDGGAPSGIPAADQVKELYDSREFGGKALEIAVLHRPQGLKAKRLVLAGGGKQDRFTAAELRKLAGAVVRSLKGKGVRSIVLALSEPFNSPDFGAAAVEGAILADTEADRYKTERAKRLSIPSPCWEFQRLRSLARAFSRTLKTLRARSRTNLRTSSLRCDWPKARGRWPLAQGSECEILDQNLMRTRHGRIAGRVAGQRGAPALIVIRYKPAGGSMSKYHLARRWARRSRSIPVEFPSSRRTAWRKCATIWRGRGGAGRRCKLIAQLKPLIPVTAFVPAVENMPGSRAQRPGDIVTTLSGKTVEVLNMTPKAA